MRRLLIIQPCWDHSEVLGGVLHYCKNQNIMVKIIYNWDREEGNYIDYYLELYKMDDLVRKINYKSPKHHLKELRWANKILFVDSIHLVKFLSKNEIKKCMNKIITINHIEKRVKYDIKVILLGIKPYERCINERKYLISSYYNPKVGLSVLNERKRYLIVGNPEERNIEWLESLEGDYELDYVHRNELEIVNKRVRVHKKIDTKSLIGLIKGCDFIITLFKSDSVYMRDRICGIIAFSVSFGKPLIMDKDYSNIVDIESDLVYENNIEDFKSVFNRSLEYENNAYLKLSKRIMEYRNIKIQEQYLNLNLVFDI